MERDWAHLGRAFAKAREKAGLTQVDAAERIGVSRGPIQTIERGATYTRITTTMRSYARLLNWTDDSIDRVLASGEPLQAEAGGRSEAAGMSSAALSESGLPLRIADELSDEGALLDTVVINLPGGGRAVVVVKGKPQGTPEEIHQSLQAWRATQPHLQELGTAGDDS